MVIGAVLALWAATLAAADENCFLQTFPPTKELQVEESTTADLVSDQAFEGCPRGFEDFSYNWTGEGGYPSGGSLTDDTEIAPGLKFVKFTKADGATNCIGAAIWNISNNQPNSPGNGDEDLQTCPNNALSTPYCNMLVVQQSGSTGGQVNDCAPGGGKAFIWLNFTEPTTLIGINYWDVEEDDGLRIRINSDGTTTGQNVPGTDGIFAPDDGDGKGSQVFLNKVKVTEWRLRFKGSGGVNGVRYCKRTTGADVVGDPHITTFDRNHYTLMTQGSFSLWRFSGLQGSDVDWQIYTHYSGHQSFTRGLLLVDRSGKRFQQALEFTAKDCKWRARTAGNEWEVVQHPQLFRAEGTSFNLTKHHVRFYMNSKRDGHDGQDEHREVAALSVGCRPGDFMNLAIRMRHPEDLKFVEGELRVARKVGTSMLQMTDSEFEQHKSWTALGGSGDASTYLEAVDEVPTSKFVSHCQESEKTDAAQICAKHLGEKMQKEAGGNADVFNDCVYDVCMGAGEVAAELAAELEATKVM